MADEQKEKIRKFKFRMPKKWKSYGAKAVLIVGAFLFAFGGNFFGDTNQLTRTELYQKVQDGQVAEVTYEDDTHLKVKLKGDDKMWEVTYPESVAETTFKRLDDAGISVKPDGSSGGNFWSILTMCMIIYVGFLIIDGIPNVKKRIAKSKGRDIETDRPTTKFSDVKGMPEVVAELAKICDVLRKPDICAKLGARLPAGVVLWGPPGTGKTLLAKALAGEVGVPFFEVTGATVRSKWIGQAGKAIHELFEKARVHPVSIIFFDEGDTLAGKRSDHGSGGDQEHRAMVNELLAQMNPNRPGGKVFVVIATNDPQLLDDALTRPGRIDLKLGVLPPDVTGRLAILEIHTKAKPLAPDVKLADLAKETYGRVGADIEALTNNAALHAASQGQSVIHMADFRHALTVMQTGPARQHAVSDEDKRVTASHEAGHTLCARVQKDVANPTSVTILAHGQSGGHTSMIPDEGETSQYTSREAAKQQLIVYMGGVAGEKMALNADYTNGPSSDRQAATALAIEMVTRWGMGTYNSAFDSNWRTGPHADEVWRQVEEFLDEAELAAIGLLLQYKPTFDKLVADLLEKETLRADDLEKYRPCPVSGNELEELRKRYEGVIDSVQMRETQRTSHNGRVPVHT